MKVTVWYRINKKGEQLHNHIEDGWIEGDYPLPVNPEYVNQKAWGNEKWEWEHKYLIDGKLTFFKRGKRYPEITEAKWGNK